MDDLLILLGLATGISGLLAKVFPRLSTKNFDMLPALAGSFLFSTIFIHLMPELFVEAHHHHFHHVGTVLLIGFFIQFLLDRGGSCIAHGHIVHTSQRKRNHLSLLVALCSHALIEGMVLPQAPKSVWLGIMLHKIPAAFILGTLLHQHKKHLLEFFLGISLFALATPTGFLLYEYLGHNDLMTDKALIIVNTLAIGTLLRISTVMLFESSPTHKIDTKKVFLIFLGTLTAILTQWPCHH